MGSHKRVILVVDDEKEVTASLESLFKSLGHEMYTAFEGKSAIEIIDRVRPELVILDIRMPNINGKEVLKKLRSTYRDIKVIVITAHEQEKEEVQKIGTDAIFIKPLDLPGLVDKIKVVLGDKEEPKAPVVSSKGKKTPKARILFVEPNINVYGYTCGLFESKEFNPGEYEVKVAFSLNEAMELFSPNSIYEFAPDIVVIYDFNTSFEDIDKLADYIMHTSFKPKEVIIHGILPRPDVEIAKLRRKGIKYCNQNVMTDTEFRQMNQKLIDYVAEECTRLDLVKK